MVLLPGAARIENPVAWFQMRREDQHGEHRYSFLPREKPAGRACVHNFRHSLVQLLPPARIPGLRRRLPPLICGHPF